MKMEYIIGALVGGFFVHLLHVLNKPHPQPQTTRASLQFRGCACKDCEDVAQEGSAYCSSHWYYEPKAKN